MVGGKKYALIFSHKLNSGRRALFFYRINFSELIDDVK